jgi:serine protease 7 (enterokinase)
MLVLVALAVCVQLAVGQDCGRTPIEPDLGNAKYTNEIVGGGPAKPYSWPWQVVMCRSTNGGTSCSLMCGGSVVHNRWVLTAAHCCSGQVAGNLWIKAGVFNQATLTTQQEASLQYIRVQQYFMHPNYNSQTLSRDACLLQLSQPLSFTDQVQPVCLPNNDEQANPPFNGIVTGWGTTNQGGGGAISAQLRQVSAPFVTNAQCDQLYAQYTVDETMLCAGYHSPPSDACQGDSGGPLVMKPLGDTRWFKAGIVSWGIGCANTNYPGVYGRVSYFCDWYASTTGGNVTCTNVSSSKK